MLDRLKTALIILVPILAMMVYLAAAMLVMQLPSFLPALFTEGGYGSGPSVLYITYWSNLALTCWLIAGAAAVAAVSVVWVIKMLGSYGWGQIGLLMVFLGLMAAGGSCLLSFAMISSEGIIGILQDCKADIRLLKEEEYAVYEGPLELGGRLSVEGVYYEKKPRLTCWLVGDTEPEAVNKNTKVYFRFGEEGARALDLRKDRLYRVEYLPNHQVAVHVERIG